ncbi:DUF2326 domain-containing protein [Bacillus sp. CFBP9009]
MTTFRDLSKAFYDKKPGGIKIKSNDGDNTIRFDILAKIQDDSSDGVNEVKIFCDMTILLMKQNHKCDFLFHDSRLFSNMDPRQRYTLFKLANDKVSNNGLQYIASINEDTLLTFKGLMTPEEYYGIIEKNTRLTLTDESDKILAECLKGKIQRPLFITWKVMKIKNGELEQVVTELYIYYWSLWTIN